MTPQNKIKIQKALESAFGFVRAFQGGTPSSYARSEEVIDQLKVAILLVDKHHVVGGVVGTGICRKCGKKSRLHVCKECRTKYAIVSLVGEENANPKW